MERYISEIAPVFSLVFTVQRYNLQIKGNPGKIQLLLLSSKSYLFEDSKNSYISSYKAVELLGSQVVGQSSCQAVFL